MYLWGESLVGLLFGAEYGSLQSLVIRLALGSSGIALGTVLSYFLLTRGERRFIVFFAGLIIVFFTSLFLIPELSLDTFVGLLVTTNIAIFVVILFETIRHSVRHDRQLAKVFGVPKN